MTATRQKSVLALAVLAVVVAVLAWLILGRGAGQEPPSNAASGPATNSPASVSASPAPVNTAADPSTTSDGAWSDSGCNGSVGTSGPPASALAQATWTPFMTTAIPSARGLGPSKIEGPLRRCYQHSPAGAVMAAANLQLAPLAPGGAQVVEAQWTDGPGKRAMRSALAGWSGSTSGIVAFRLEGCDPSACNVQLVSAAAGRYGQSVMPMVWRNGDWLVDGSRLTPDPTLIPGIPPGFTAWGAS